MGNSIECNFCPLLHEFPRQAELQAELKFHNGNYETSLMANGRPLKTQRREEVSQR